MTRKEQLSKIKNWIGKARLKEAVDALLAYTIEHVPNQEKELITLSSKYYEVETMVRNTTIAMPDYQRIRSQLIINLLDKIASFEVMIEDKGIATTPIAEIYKLSIARTQVLRLLKETTTGLPIKAIHETTGLKYRKFIIATLEELIAAGMVERYRENGVSLNQLTDHGRNTIKTWGI